MADKLEELEKMYCPPLDSATFYAIAADFDLNDVVQLQNAQQTLDLLKSSASSADTEGFDPSGSSNPKDQVHHGDLSTPAASQSGDTDIRSIESTGVSDLTSSLDAFTFEDNGPIYDKGIDEMTLDEKSALMQEMFGDLKPFDVRFALKKRNGDFGAAVEELLNIQYLQEEAAANGGKETLRGVDGFAASSDGPRRGKGKPKGKGRKIASNVELEDRLTEGSLSSANRWKQGSNDVKFITERTMLKEELVRSIYNAHSHSLHQTVVAICKKSPADDLKCSTDPDDALVQSRIVDLAGEFPSVHLHYLSTVVLLTHPLFIAAKELAQVLADAVPKRLVPKYSSVEVENNPTHTDSDIEDESHFLAAPDLPVTGSYRALRSSAFAQASAAYRKSRSSPLMGGAAAHYASVGHAANAAIKRERAVAANIRVAGQSAANSCDLHGVTIADARRIAKQYVERWWTDRQEWAREGKAMGNTEYRVVVGRGSHSADGKGKLGPAVSKMLRAEGWRVDEQIGEIIVRGRQRK